MSLLEESGAGWSVPVPEQGQGNADVKGKAVYVKAAGK